MCLDLIFPQWEKLLYFTEVDIINQGFQLDLDGKHCQAGR